MLLEKVLDIRCMFAQDVCREIGGDKTGGHASSRAEEQPTYVISNY
jgi:hypothetical protein